VNDKLEIIWKDAILEGKGKKDKAVPVTGREGSWGLETSRHPHLDSRLIDGGKVVGLTPRPPFTPQENSWYSFLLEAESTSGSWCGWKHWSIEKSNDGAILEGLRITAKNSGWPVSQPRFEQSTF
jgi:hypothetical protein